MYNQINDFSVADAVERVLDGSLTDIKGITGPVSHNYEGSAVNQC